MLVLPEPIIPSIKISCAAPMSQGYDAAAGSSSCPQAVVRRGQPAPSAGAYPLRLLPFFGSLTWVFVGRLTRTG